jgi:fructose-1,6-bisphosphatase II
MTQPVTTAPDAWQDAALMLARVTQAAALAAWRWRGHGLPDQADEAAAHAIRAQLAHTRWSMRVVSGEGEKDGVHHVAYAERFGPAPAADGCALALDPIDGTTRLSLDRGGSLSAAALVPDQALFDPGPSHYMQKIVCCERAGRGLDPEAPPSVIVSQVARALDKAVQDLTVFVLEKPRHQPLIAELRALGVRVACHDAGDLEAALLAATPGSSIDLLLGIGGTPEGMVAACGVRALGGHAYLRLAPQRAPEQQALAARGLYPSRFHSVNELVPAEAACAVTGITPCNLVAGIEATSQHLISETLVLWHPGEGHARVRRVHARGA